MNNVRIQDGHNEVEAKKLTERRKLQTYRCVYCVSFGRRVPKGQIDQFLRILPVTLKIYEINKKFSPYFWIKIHLFTGNILTVNFYFISLGLIIVKFYYFSDKVTLFHIFNFEWHKKCRSFAKIRMKFLYYVKKSINNKTQSWW